MMNRLYQHLAKSMCNAFSCLVVDRCYSVHNIFHLFFFHFSCIYDDLALLNDFATLEKAILSDK